MKKGKIIKIFCINKVTVVKKIAQLYSNERKYRKMKNYKNMI